MIPAIDVKRLAVLSLALLLGASALVGCGPRNRHHTELEISNPPLVRGRTSKHETVLVHVKERGRRFKMRDYKMLYGASGRSPTVQIRNSELSIMSGYGWIYIFGQYPRAETHLVHASATGTTFILGTYSDRSRIVFLCSDDGEGLTVTSKRDIVGDSRSHTLNDPWHYIDAIQRADGKVEFTLIRPVPRPGEADPDGVRAFVETVRQVAIEEHGLDGWCSQPGVSSPPTPSTP